MTPFLKAVAKDLYDRLDGDLSKTAVIFPNKRAGLFFNQWLAQQSDRPVWTPTYLTISDLFRRLGDLQVGDSVKLVCLLHRIFKEETGNEEETLDNFYFWGEMLIADFDDLDKNMADADRLFRNLSELKELADDHSYLTPEQEEALRLFFHNFSIEKSTELKRRFTELWNALGRIYRRFRETLAAQQIAYEGQLYRIVAENPDFSRLPYEHYAFVGFNVLNQVETRLFKRLQDAGKALFYWDYDEYYVGNIYHEAGEFLRRNLRLFPNALEDVELFRCLDKPKEVVYIESPTENAQARYVPDWLKEHLTETENETAVVLCNEALLQPVLHALPAEEVKALNITMGYPLSQTPVYGLLSLLTELYTTGYDERRGRYSYRQVAAVLKHPYVLRLSSEAEELEKRLTKYNRFYPLPSELQRDEVLTRLFPGEGIRTAKECCACLLKATETVAELFRGGEEEKTSPTSEEQLQQEALFRCHTQLNRFHKLLEEGELDITLPTLNRLLKNVLGSLSIAFHGEPAVGLQVMGVLETRCLDFRHLLMLSVNEGKLPKAEGDSSFIPYNLRRAFGMTTVEHKNAVYAYYFYRLIQRAEKVTLVYNTGTEGLNRGEMSRFMLQYLVEGIPLQGGRLKRYALTAAQGITRSAPMTLSDPEEISRRIRRRFTAPDRILSPTALNTYIDCPRKFALKYGYGLKESDEVSTEIESSDFGNIFHRTAEIIYKEILSERNPLVRKEDIETLLKDDLRIRECVNRAFKEEFFLIGEKEQAEYNGLQLLNKEVIVTYIRQLLRRDAEHTPFTFLGAEIPIRQDISLHPSGEEPLTLTLGGNIDRMDCKEGVVRIVDYKTGIRVQKADDVAQLFDGTDEERPYHIFQTALYCDMLSAQRNEPISPALFYIQKASSSEYDPTVKIGGEAVTDFARTYREEFSARLADLLQEIFSTRSDWPCTTVEKHCNFCEFAKLCGK